VTRIKQNIKLVQVTSDCYCIAIRAIRGLGALTALEMNWTEDDTIETTVNNISNITFIEL